MATLVLQAAGAFLGGAFGSLGATIGAAAGSLAGYVIDRQIVASTQTIEGPRLASARPFTAEEGSPIARVYGTARIGGTVIWATRFEETKTTKRQGFKGGPKVSSYSYFANVAFGLCEGEIATIRRVWADGRELDLETIDMRVHNGTKTQLADPLIEAKQGTGNTPAYRGTAYAVFERFPIGDYGNRIPQFQFEVIRTIGGFPERIRSVCLIPGSTEYGLSPSPVTQKLYSGSAKAENRHAKFGRSDFAASVDELQALCPNLENIAVVVTWFANDLRAGKCLIRPAVTDVQKAGLSSQWSVAGVERSAAIEVSRHEGAAAFGGTPSDRSVRDAIADLKARGLKVTLYPFIMMDIPAGNGLPDPYGSTEQRSYPWRGRITCNPALGQPGSADKTADASQQLGALAGTANPDDFSGNAADGFTYTGNTGEWSYRRFIMHYAHLCVEAGGIDTFLIGSELRGLTAVRDNTAAFPFVGHLAGIASDVKSVLGTGTAVTYGADWSEYFGYHPDDGSGDVLFNLDPLWSSPSIDAVGIDNYMPLSDWRDEDYAGGNPDGFESPYDSARLRVSINSGEGYDWYYATASDRENRSRTLITDGAFGKPWTFRYKDLASWWSNVHFDRFGGVEASEATQWLPGSKPVWFMEAGCAAVDKGPNQPNVFRDPKSSEFAIPYFSNGGRSDFAQRSYLQALLCAWDPEAPEFVEAANPASSLYAGRMVDASRIYLWAWDSRPFPAFPLLQSDWSDGANWYTGHWLNGRLSAVAVCDLIAAIVDDFELPGVDVSAVEGVLSGYLLLEPQSARSALESLLQAFGVRGWQTGDLIHFSSRPAGTTISISQDEVVAIEGKPLITLNRGSSGDIPTDVAISFINPLRGYQPSLGRAAAVDETPGRVESLVIPAIVEQGMAEVLCAQYRRAKRTGRTTLEFGVAHGSKGLAPGDIIELSHEPGKTFEIAEIEDGDWRKVTARRIALLPPVPDLRGLPDGMVDIPAGETEPFACLLDLPLWDSERAPQDQLRVAVWSDPWQPCTISVSPETTGFSPRALASQPATVGYLQETLPPGFSGRMDFRSQIRLFSPDGEFSSVSHQLLLSGANLAAVQSSCGVWEIIQFELAEDLGGGSWLLSSLLRGQAGTEDAAGSGSLAGARFILLDEAVISAGLRGSEIGLDLNWRIEAAVNGVGSAFHTDISQAGGLRALTPYAPVHLRARELADGSISFSWIRRGRTDADSWLGTEIPLDEDGEAYLIEISAAGSSIRSLEVSAPAWTYSSADRAEDFGAGTAIFDIAVRQLSSRVGPGLPATGSFDF